MDNSKSLARNRLYSLISRHLWNRNWQDYDDFVETFAAKIVESFAVGEFDLDEILKEASGAFLRLNNLRANVFLSDDLKGKILRSWNESTDYSVPALTFGEIFPELAAIDDSEAEKIELGINEQVIQNALRKALRDKGGTPIPKRGKDSAVEVADIEDFVMQIKSRKFVFTGVVKGKGSLDSKKINLEAVAHQILKAYRTRPDYIILCSTTDPVDAFRSDVVDYCASVGNRNLVIFVPPLDLAKFLIWQGIVTPPLKSLKSVKP